MGALGTTIDAALRIGFMRMIYLGNTTIVLEKDRTMLLGHLCLRSRSRLRMIMLYKVAIDIYADLSQTNPHFKKLYDSLVAFRGDSLLWLQVAELSFDSFMIRMRTRT